MDTRDTEASSVPTPQPPRFSIQPCSAVEVFWSPTLTREELQPPSSDDIQFRGNVEVLHPGYGQTLFSLPAFDCVAGRFGVNRSIVEDSCRIITNNEDGFLAIDREGNVPVSNVDPLLERGQYYYHLVKSPGSTKYLVVADFASWVFPKTPPTHWSRVRTVDESAARLAWARSAAAMSVAVKNLDGCCIVTKYSSLTENAHLVPQNQSDWFTANDMDQFSIAASADIDDVANGVTLRSDVHACIDQHSFVFYPTDQGRYVAYVVGYQLDYAKLFHRRLVAMHPRVAIQFLYARFAYTIIHLLRRRWATPNRSFPIPKEVLEVRNAAEEEAEEEANLKRKREDEEDADAERSATPVTHSPRHGDASSSVGSMLPLSEDPAVAARDKRWQERLIERFPIIHKLPEVEYPPDVGIGCHLETPHMQRLREAYIAKNPQVRQVTGPTASEDDVECWDMSDDGMTVDEEDGQHSPPRPGTIVHPNPPSSS
ncbi:hypothetical protein C8Q74DRAFT_1446188 [Fomes fomentarius]|nr:hypothetical protein C8Q74DRAFT_1446188 [Fomes fomentarius]